MHAIPKHIKNITQDTFFKIKINSF